MMEVSFLKDVLDCISWFCSFSSENSVNSELVQRYGQEINEIFKLSMPILEDILSSGIDSDENLEKMLRELSIFAEQARKLESGWHQMTSKIYFVLQVESLINKIKTVLQHIVFVTSSQSIERNSYADFVEKMQLITCENISDIIKDAVHKQLGNMIPGSELTEKIAGSLSLTKNEELLMELIALDRLKVHYGENPEEIEFIDHTIALVNYMHYCHVDKYLLHNINNISIPSDFCCPLSLQLMVDPVIVASGQTYERAFIKEWLEHGLAICPKTKQILSHTNLIPNYTVKALIANWCETYSIKLPDPAKSVNLNWPDPSTPSSSVSSKDGHPMPPESSMILLEKIDWKPRVSNGHTREALLPEMLASSHTSNALTGISERVADESGTDVVRLSITGTGDDTSNSEKQHAVSRLKISNTGIEFQDQSGITSASLTLEGASLVQGGGDFHTISQVPRNLTHSSSDISSESTQEIPSSSALQMETEFTPRFEESRARGNSLQRRPSDKFGSHVSSLYLDTRQDISGIETQVQQYVLKLKSNSIDEQRAAAIELRHLAKHSTENRIVIANSGAIPELVNLLRSADPKTQENAVTALLNLSINDNNKMAITNADAIDPLIYVLKAGSTEAKENSAATLFSLSVIEENKARIGRCGAIGPLVELLQSGTPRGRKDAATALFNLSIFHENKSRIVQAGAVKHLVELMDPASGMVDKAVAVLANLATISEGRSAIGREGGIPYLVEVVELGSSRGKENAAAALLLLCTNSNKFCAMVLQEGAVPPIVALSQSGTSRAKEKAQLLLSHIKSQRRGNSGSA